MKQLRTPKAPRKKVARLSDILSEQLLQTAQRQGFARSEILTEWSSIVGKDLSRRCQPVRVQFPRGQISGAVLHMRVQPGAAPEIQHRQTQILDRVNAFLGYGAVAKLSLMQGPVEPPKPTPQKMQAPAIDADMAARIDRSLNRVRDHGLADALARLKQRMTRPS